MGDHAARAAALFSSGSNCAQSVLGAFAGELGLIGLDIGTPEGSARARKLGVFETKCRAFVVEAAGMLEGMLQRPEP